MRTVSAPEVIRTPSPRLRRPVHHKARSTVSCDVGSISIAAAMLVAEIMSHRYGSRKAAKRALTLATAVSR